MLNLYTTTLMPLKRAGKTMVRDVQPTNSEATARPRWLPNGHWWRQQAREIDLDRL